MYLLDTNTLIYFFKNQGRVAEYLLATPPSNVALSAVVLYELEVGILKAGSSVARRQQLHTLASSARIVAFDEAAAVAAARLRAALEDMGRPIGPLDTLIAGTALAHGAILVTRNVDEFARVPDLRVVDWYI